jgi:hypothetical protein
VVFAWNSRLPRDFGPSRRVDFWIFPLPTRPAASGSDVGNTIMSYFAGSLHLYRSARFVWLRSLRVPVFVVVLPPTRGRGVGLARLRLESTLPSSRPRISYAWLYILLQLGYPQKTIRYADRQDALTDGYATVIRYRLSYSTESQTPHRCGKTIGYA